MGILYAYRMPTCVQASHMSIGVTEEQTELVLISHTTNEYTDEELTCPL